MSPEKSVSHKKMDKIRIVVEYSELSEDQKAEYLKKNGIDEEVLKIYQQEAASVVGVSVSPEPPKPKSRCEELIEELKDDNENTRRDAVKELGFLRHRATPAVEPLIDTMLNDSIDFVRSWSAWALTRIHPRHEKVIEGFLKALSEDGECINTRNWSVVGLSVSESDYAKDQLIKILHTGEPFAQFAAIEVLIAIKENSMEYIDGLKIAADSYNESLKLLAQKELTKLQPED